MKQKLKNLFDLQRFQNDKKLQALIDETHSRYSKEISEDDLEFVNAAGDVSQMVRRPFKTEGRNE